MSKEQEQLKQMVDSIRYIFICDYCIFDNGNQIKIDKGTIVEIDKVIRHIDTDLEIECSYVYFKVWISVAKKLLHIPIDDFKFCTKSFDSRETSVD